MATGIALAAPTLLAHYPPMSDLPLHEGLVGILRHLGDESYFPRDLYTLNLGQANQLFYLVAWVLSYAVGTIWALKLVIAASQVLIFWTGARLATHLGRSTWGVPLLAPLALGFTYYWGLVANLVGFAAFLGALPALDKAAARPSMRGAMASCGLLVLLFFAHEAMFVAAVALLGMFTVAYPFERRNTAIRVVPIAFAVLFMGAHWIYQARSFTRGQITPPMTFEPFSQKVLAIPKTLFGDYDIAALLMLLAVALIALAALCVSRVRSAGPEGAPPVPLRSLREALLRYRFETAALAFFVLYFVTPYEWRGASLIHQRFLAPAWALLVVCASPRQAPWVAKVASAILPVAVLLFAWPQFVDSDRTYRDLDDVIARIPRKSAVALVAMERPLLIDPRRFSAAVGPARAVADRGGRVSLSLTVGPLAPVQVRPEWRWDDFDVRARSGGSRALKPAHDLDRYGWIIVDSRDVPVRRLLIDALEPDAQYVMTQGEFVLLRSTHPQASLTSPDVPAPAAMETVVDRVNRLWRTPAGRR
jgi:hypothetical protein